MKNKIVLLVAGIMLMAGITAAADSIDVTQDSQDKFKISVKYTSEIRYEKATVQMFDENMTTLIYMGEGTPVVNNGEYVCTFDDFNINTNLPKGNYNIRVGNGTNIISKVMPFENPIHKRQKLLAILEATTDSGLDLAIEAAKGYFEFGYNEYSALTDWKSKIRYNILAEEWGTGKDTDVLITELSDFMNKLFEAIDIMTESEANVLSKISNAVYTVFDRTYFTSDYISDESYIAGKVAGHNFLQYDGVATDELEKVFDGAILTYIINNNDWVTAETVLKFYDRKGLVTVDFASNYNGLDSTKKSNVFSLLKQEGITEYTNIAARFAYHAQQQAGNSSGGSGQGNNTGGGGGGGAVSKDDGNISTVVPPNLEIFEKEEKKEEVRAEEFGDLGSFGWAKTAINGLSKMGAISGDGKGNFNPADVMTREQFITVVALAYSIYDENAESDFDDIPKTDWSYKYVSSAYKEGIIHGTGENTFGRNTSITRQDAALILYRLYSGGVTASGETNFGDNGEIAPYARGAVAEMTKLGAVSGFDGKFNPKGYLTRAEGAQMIYNMINID